MATGAGYYDANGVWIYGENDSIALVSDLLNVGEISVSDQFTADRSRLTVLEANIGSRFAAASSTARDAHFGVPANDTQRLALQNTGAECLRTDLGYTEAYFATYNASTNPGGATPHGWYPVVGSTPMANVRTATAQTVTTTVAALTFSTPTDLITRAITWDAATGKATATVAGVYRFTGQVVFNATTSGTKGIYVWKNGATIHGTAITTAVITPLTVTAVFNLAVGDTVQLAAYANVSTTTSPAGGSYNVEYNLEYLGVTR